jgi:hypothetical protein
MSQGSSSGSRRCDAKCYNASTSKCTCICGGRNHGAGLKTAQLNTRQFAEEVAVLKDIKFMPQQLEIFNKNEEGV